MSKAVRITCRAFAVEVETNEAGIITHASARARRFLWRPLESLTGWMRKFGGFAIEPIPNLFDGTTENSGDQASDDYTRARADKAS